MKSWGYVATPGGKVEEIATETACRHFAPQGLTWAHFDAREGEARDWLLANSGLDEAIVSALLAFETRPRLLRIGEGALINLRGLGATPDDDLDALVSVRLWAQRGRVISVSLRSLAAMPDLRQAMMAGELRDPGDLISKLGRLITDALDPVVAALGDTVDDCEERIEPGTAWEMRRTIARARSDAIAYRRFVQPQRVALERLAETDADLLEEEDRFHLREAADRFARMAEELESVRERAALLHEQLTDLRSETMDQRSLMLAIVALIFLPLTFLTGLFGMNVEIPWAKSPNAFWEIIALCAALSGAISAYFMLAHWLRR